MLVNKIYNTTNSQNTINTYVLPFMEIRKIYLPISIHMLSCFNSHWASRLNETDRGIIWIRVQQPQADWNIVCITWERKRNFSYSIFIIFNGLVGKQERVTTKQHLKKSQQIFMFQSLFKISFSNFQFVKYKSRIKEVTDHYSTSVSLLL